MWNNKDFRKGGLTWRADKKYDMGTFRPQNTRKHSTQFPNAQYWLSGKYEELARCNLLAKRFQKFSKNPPSTMPD